MFHVQEELFLFGARGDTEPLVRIEGRGRHTLRGRWSELATEGGDGRAHLVLEEPGTYRVAGFSALGATRFRLRRRSAVVEGHVWLEADSLVRVTGAHGLRVRAACTGPFESPKELALEVACSDLAYDGRTERVTEPSDAKADAHVERLELRSAPGGPLVFHANSGLFFVHVDEYREDFAHIRGERCAHRGMDESDPRGSRAAGKRQSRR